MSLQEAMTIIQSEQKEPSEPKKKNVTFEVAEWEMMERKHGKKINPVNIKQLVLKIFAGEMTITPNTRK